MECFSKQKITSKLPENKLKIRNFGNVLEKKYRNVVMVTSV